MTRWIIALVLCLGLGGCAHTSSGKVSPIATAANITFDVSKSTRVVEDTIRQANAAGFVSVQTTAAVLALMARIDQAGLDVNQVLRSQATLSAGQTSSIKTILNPLLTAIQNAVSQNVPGISDANTRNQVVAALAGIQTAINTTLAAIGGN